MSMLKGGEVGGEGGREGDWECSSCNNRNYAFRSFCNRCKQPRLLVDTKTPSDSKWLPRIGDWICTGQLLCPQPPTNQSISFLFFFVYSWLCFMNWALGPVFVFSHLICSHMTQSCCFLLAHIWNTHQSLSILLQSGQILFFQAFLNIICS